LIADCSLLIAPLAPLYFLSLVTRLRSRSSGGAAKARHFNEIAQSICR